MYFDLLDSTNNYVKRNIKDLNHLDVVTALEQSKGKGRDNREWMSGKGNLYYSILIKKNIKHKDLFKYIMISSLALVKTLNYFNIKSDIKYPNDILVDSKKIAGILLESGGFSDIEYLVIGIGLNVNQAKFDYLSNKAISMNNINGKNFGLKEVLKMYLYNFELFLTKDIKVLINNYLEYSFVLNKLINIENQLLKVVDISAEGLITLQKDDYILTRSFNEISLKDIY